MFHWFRRRIAWFLIAVMVLTPQLAVAQQPRNMKDVARRSALTLIPADATAGFIVHPRSAMLDPSMQMLPVEVISAMGKQQLGFDPLDVEVVVGAVKLEGAPEIAVALRLRQALELGSLAPALVAGTSEETLKGKPYLKADPGGLSFYLPNARTLFVGTDAMIHKMMERTGSADAGVLHGHLAAGTPADLQLVVVLQELQGMIQGQLAMLPPLPGPLEALKGIPNDTEAVELRVNVARGWMGELTLHANEEAAAEHIGNVIDDSISVARRMALAQLTQSLTSGDEEVNAAMRKYTERMADMITEMLRPKRDGSKLTIGGSFEAQANTLVIATLVTLLLPAVQAAREAARRNNSINNLRRLVLALLNHESATQHFPPHAVYGEDNKPLLSWRVKILPYIEEQALYEEFHLDESWDSEHNKKLIERMPPIFANPNGGKPGKTHYLGLVGENFFFRGDSEGRPIRNITDGTSKSICIVEADNPVIWTKPDDYQFDEDNPIKGLGNMRAGNVFGAAFVDGHVLSISRQIDVESLKAMMTINGAEPVR